MLHAPHESLASCSTILASTIAQPPPSRPDDTPINTSTKRLPLLRLRLLPNLLSPNTNSSHLPRSQVPPNMAMQWPNARIIQLDPDDSITQLRD